MPQYLSPGVYVEEIPSAVQAIAGVGTSTAGFIGVFAANSLTVPAPNPYYNPTPGAPADIEVSPSAAKLTGVTLAEAVDLGGGTTLAVGTVLTQTQADAVAKVVNANADVTKRRVKVKNTAFASLTATPPDAGEVKLCTNYGEFAKAFGDFSTDPGQNTLAHAVNGFFRNGGTRCFVARAADENGIPAVLAKFAAIDEIALVAAPGVVSAAARDYIVSHCAIDTQDRFAILDSTKDIAGDPTLDNISPPPNSDYAAFYFPWLKVVDPATRFQNPASDGYIFVPPSGHVAGIYARTDNTRGVHKAPANAPVVGALGLRYQISKAHQDGLNPQGVNCIRDLNGNIRVWGARTVGGNANGEWRYINVRRTFLYLRESIDEGMQWAVFEPNDQNLWAKIRLNVSAFLTTVWRSGALFGSTAQEAFYVKCDAETNPPELREIGQVVTEIGVAVVKPAEFVIFRISQWQPQPGG